MSRYRYIFCDLLTNQVIAELPCYGVYFNRRLSGKGSCTATVALDSSGYNNSDIIEATIPGRTSLYIDREGGLVWGGILWSRTYQSQSKSLSLTGETFESFFAKSYVESSLTQTNVDLRTIVVNLVNQMQAKPYSNIGIVVPSAFSGGASATVKFNDYEVWSYAKAIDQISAMEGGPEYTIEVQYDSNDNPTKVLLVGSPLGSSYYDTQLVFEYPGNVKNYWLPESASGSAVSVIGIGAGEGTKMVRDKFTNQSLLNGGYPNLQGTYTNKDTKDSAQLGGQTRAEAERLKVPVIVPTIEVRSELEPIFGSYPLGTFAKFRIDDARYDNYEQPIRIIGWEIRPTSSEQAEDVKLVVAGEDEVQ